MKKYLIIFCILVLIIGISYWLLPIPSEKTIVNSQSLNSIKAHIQSQDLTKENGFTVSREECFDLFKNEKTADALERKSKNLEKKFLHELSEKGYNLQQIETIKDIAGLNNDKNPAGFQQNYAGSTDGYMPGDIILADNYQQLSEFKSADRNSLNNWLKARQYQDLVIAVKNNQINTKNIIFGKSLLYRAIEHNPKITIAELQLLIDAGAEIHQDAILNAINYADSQTVIFLAENYKGDLSNSWHYNQSVTNLAMSSARKFREDLFVYFIQKGVRPFEQDWKNGNTNFLDTMPEPKTDEEKQRALSFVVNALNSDIKPSKYSTAERLKKWLPTEVSEKHRDLLSFNEISAEYIELGNQFKQQAQLIKEEQLTAAQLELTCKTEINYDVMSYLDEMLKDFNGAANLSLQTKILFEKYKSSLIQNQWKAAAASEKKPSSETEELKTTMTSLHNHLFDKDWDAALNYCSSYPNPKIQQSLCMAVLQSYAHENTADLAYIERILPFVDSISPSLVTTLAMHNRVDIIKQLSARGLQLDQITADNDPISWAIRMKKNTEAIEYLLANGVPAKFNHPGLDSLDVALAKMDQYNPELKDGDGTNYLSTPEDIAALFKAGISFDRSHIEKLRELKFTNPKGYETLIKLIPSLSAY